MGYLRWALAMSVVLTHVLHSKWYMGFGGANSVEVFFFLSGFLMQLVIRYRYRSSFKFLLNRMLRIYPTYYLVLAATFLYLYKHQDGAFLNSALIEHGNQPVVSVISVFSNLTLIGSDSLNFINYSISDGFGLVSRNNGLGNLSLLLLIAPAWSLGLELTCYIFVPIFSKLKTRKIAFVISMLLCLRAYCLLRGYTEDPWTYRFLMFEIPIFLLGMILARLQINYNFTKKLGSLKVLAIVVAFFLSIGAVNYFMNPPRYIILFALICVSALIVLFGREDRTSKYLGKLSYPIYLSHVLIGEVSTTLFGDLISNEIILLLIFLVVLHIASSIVLILVNPIERFRSSNRAD